MPVKPLRDLVLVQRIAEDRVTAGGIHLPESFAGTNSQKIGAKRDYWRGRVLAVGPDVRELVEGDQVLVHTWAGESGKGLYTGTASGLGDGVFVGPDDIICAVDP